MNAHRLSLASLLFLTAAASSALAADRPKPPGRDPHSPGYVEAKELPAGAVPPIDAEGNFIVGPTHEQAAEMQEPKGGLRGRVQDLIMKSADSKLFPGIARDK